MQTEEAEQDEISPLLVDVKKDLNRQRLEILGLRLIPLFLTLLILVPTQFSEKEKLLTTSWFFWGPLCFLVTAICGQWLAGTEARAFQYSQRQGGTLLRVDPKGLNLPHVATMGPAREKAVQTGKPILVIPWSEIRGIALTPGRRGPQFFKIELGEDGWLLAGNHVFLRKDVFNSEQEKRFLALAQEFAGQRALPTGALAENLEPVLRKGLSNKELETNRKVILGTGSVFLVGIILSASAGWIEMGRAVLSVVVLAFTAGSVIWKIDLQLLKRPKA